MRFKEQLMSKDEYPSMFLNLHCVYYLLNIFLGTQDLKIKEYAPLLAYFSGLAGKNSVMWHF